ncbi:hypothetical protein BYT27DRAFT_7299417 [Phlegmacium glaucopus]|nr:hypothetical protein BYT27DRAFT_7299417 [Phlegmacium glaucopus]
MGRAKPILHQKDSRPTKRYKGGRIIEKSNLVFCDPSSWHLQLPSTMSSNPLSVVRLVVSTDSEQYTVVDVTGARDGSWIRQRIFSKLFVDEQSRGKFSIYPSEIGSYALGGALSDRRLFVLCRESGDPSGSLKLFVSTSPDRPPSALDTGFTRERFPVCGDIHSYPVSSHSEITKVMIDKHFNG